LIIPLVEVRATPASNLFALQPAFGHSPASSYVGSGTVVAFDRRMVKRCRASGKNLPSAPAP
jgi:hypothetical protein